MIIFPGRPTMASIHPVAYPPKDPEDFPIMLCAHTIISRFLLANFHAPHHHQYQWAWNAVQRMMKMRGGGGGCMNWRFFAPTKNWNPKLHVVGDRINIHVHGLFYSVLFAFLHLHRQRRYLQIPSSSSEEGVVFYSIWTLPSQCQRKRRTFANVVFIIIAWHGIPRKPLTSHTERRREGDWRRERERENRRDGKIRGNECPAVT